jgi:O-antigen/teichoic acid export membrane protein
MAFITAGSMIFVNVILNYLFIPKYSYIAASWTTVVTELLVFICYYSFISNYIYRVGIIQLLLKPLLAVMVMGIFIYQLRSLNLSVLILLGMLIYFIVLLILKTFSPEDKRIFRELVSFGK